MMYASDNPHQAAKEPPWLAKEHVSYGIVVRGDVRSTGCSNVAQLIGIAEIINDTATPTAMQLEAADIDGSGTVGLADLVKAARFLTQLDADGSVFPQSPCNLKTVVPNGDTLGQDQFDLASVPFYSGLPYVEVHNNLPYFEMPAPETTSYERYSVLDIFGRCQAATACVGTDLMPTATREFFQKICPTGWQSVQYAGIVPGDYLYNRCHLIGFQLTAEGANELNLITGTRYLNTSGMLPFENMVADYVRETNNHVLYRATPVFVNDELVARGVLIEGCSVEDQGSEILFCAFAYNVQPGIEIDYQTGNSWPSVNTLLPSSEPVPLPTAAPEPATSEPTEASAPPLISAPAAHPTPDNPISSAYVLNTNSRKFHLPGCSAAKRISPANRQDAVLSRDEILANGYVPCKLCSP